MRGIDKAIIELKSYTFTRRKLEIMMAMSTYLEQLKEINEKNFSIFKPLARQAELLKATEDLISEIDKIK